jgi:hypothetical protein
MGLFTDPLDPSNTYGQAIKDRVHGYAEKLGQALLGKGTGQDATGQTQDAYKQYAESMMSQGMQPLSLQQWMAVNQQSQQMR